MILLTCSRSAVSSSDSTKPLLVLHQNIASVRSGFASYSSSRAQSVEPQLPDPFEIVGAPRAFEFGIDFADVPDGVGRLCAIALRTHALAHGCRVLFERAEIVGQSPLSTSRCSARDPARRRQTRRRARLRSASAAAIASLNVSAASRNCDAFARGLFRRHRRTHHVGIVEASLRRALDRAIRGEPSRRALRMTAGRGIIHGSRRDRSRASAWPRTNASRFTG